MVLLVSNLPNMSIKVMFKKSFSFFNFLIPIYYSFISVKQDPKSINSNIITLSILKNPSNNPQVVTSSELKTNENIAYQNKFFDKNSKKFNEYIII